ncbi:MAG: hypothetical protein II458_09295 [Oscillospiraceae bacterium]|nr:hypothetical protein [Oscillospiraceae bacterium]
MGKLLNTPLFRRFPPYVWLCFAAMFAVQMLVFSGTRVFLPYLPSHVLTTALDSAIPFVPAWVTVYFLSFAVWIINGFWITSESKPHGYRFSFSYILSLLISAAVFLLYPGTMTRPELTGDGILMAMMRFLYWIDSPTNLCPSLHVVITYFCWRGAWGCRKIPLWYKWFSFVFLILVCFSILFVKQHALVDIPAALIVAELALQLGRLLRIERIPYAIEEAFAKRKRRSSQ